MQDDKQREASFLKRIREHQGILHKICFVYTGSGTEKEDLYQEIILQLWKSYPSYEGRSEFSTWMYRVALNTAISMTRKPAFFTDTDKIPALSYDAEGMMDSSEEIKILYMAISQLKKVERAVILLWLEEKSYEEIADLMGISVKNVSVRLHRVKAKLAEIIRKIHQR